MGNGCSFLDAAYKLKLRDKGRYDPEHVYEKIQISKKELGKERAFRSYSNQKLA